MKKYLMVLFTVICLVLTPVAAYAKVSFSLSDGSAKTVTFKTKTTVYYIAEISGRFPDRCYIKVANITITNNQSGSIELQPGTYTFSTYSVNDSHAYLTISYTVPGEESFSLSAGNGGNSYSAREITFKYATTINYRASAGVENNNGLAIKVANRQIPIFGQGGNWEGSFIVPPGTYTFSVHHGTGGGGVYLYVHYIEHIPEEEDPPITLYLDNITINGYICNPVNIRWIHDVTESRSYRIFNSNGENITPGGDSVKQKSLQLNLSEGEHQLYVKGYDDYGNETPESNPIRFHIDGSPPVNCSLIINSQNQYTKSSLVTLNISAQDSNGGIRQLYLSEDKINYTLLSTIDPTSVYVDNILYNITTPGDGSKIIYVKVSDVFGNSTVFSNQITLDTQPPVGTIAINSPGIIIKNNQKYISSTLPIILNLEATDLYSPVATMQFSNDGINYQPKVPYNTSTTYAIPNGDGLKKIYVRFGDALGNETVGATVFDSVIRDTSSPAGKIAAISNSKTYINNGKIYTGDPNVDLTLEADDGAGVGVASMCFSNDGLKYSEWETYATVKTWAMDSITNDGSRTIYARFRDLFGQEVFVQSPIILDRTAANGSIAITSIDGRPLSMNDPVNSLKVKLRINTQDNLGPNNSNSGVKGVLIWNGENTDPSIDSVFVPLSDITTQFDWTLAEGPDGVRTVSTQVVDNVGNLSESLPVKVAVDRVAPGMPQNITHSYSGGFMTFKWTPGEPSADISQYCGTYILPNGIEKPFSVTPSETKEGQYQIRENLSANQPVIIKICSVDRATNESVMAEHLGCTPAEPGKLQFLKTGYDTTENKHYLAWKLVEPGISETHKLEYGKVLGEEFIPSVEITSSADGVFTHNAAGPNPEDKLQPHATYQYRLVAYNKAGDRTYIPVFTQEVQNLPPVKPEIVEFAPAGYASSKVVFDYPEVQDYDNDAISYAVKWAEGSNPALGAYQNATWDQELGKYTINLNSVKHGTTYSWYLEAKDSYGAVTSSDVVKFVLDVNNPTITLEKPKSLYTNLKELKVSVKDDLSGIKLLEYKVGNLEPKTVQLTAGTGGEMVGRIPLAEGQYNLKVTVQDQAGNRISEDVNNLWVDHTLPTLDTSSIVIDLGTKDGTYLTSGIIPVSWKANDSGSGIAGIRYWILSNGEQSGQGTYISLSSGLPLYAHKLEIGAGKANGQNYNLALAVVDKAGNSSDIYRLSQNFLLDITPPEANLAVTGLYPNGSSLYLTDMENLQAILTIIEEESGATGSFNLIDSAAGTPITIWDSWENVNKAILTPGGKYRVAARVINGVGLETEVRSEEFTFDNSAPIISGLTGPAQPLISGESFIINLTADEYETNIVKYRIAIGVELGATEFTSLIPGNQNGWYEIKTNSLQPQIRMEVPEIADGTYHITLEAVNAAGITSRFSEDRILTVNNHQERIVVSNQGPYTMFADRLRGWWTYKGARVPEKYHYWIKDSKANIIYEADTNSTEVTKDGLVLDQGETYHFEVQAIFDQNDVSTPGISSGVTVDATVPVINELKTPLYVTPNNFGFEWTGSDDCSGISRVLAAVGTDYNQTDVTKGWVEVTGNNVKLSRDINGEPLVFNLENTKRYYLTLRLINGAGLTAEKAAPAIVVDNTPPPTPVVFDQGGFINTKPEQPMEAHWFWSETDPDSGCTYQWTILKYGEKVSPLTEWNEVDDTKRISLTMDDFQREHGETYYFAIKAINGAGLTSIGYSDGIMADATAPYLLKVKVLDATNQSGEEEINYVTDSNKTLRLWIDSYDPQSNVAYYLYAWNIPGEVDQTKRSSSTGEPINIDNPDLIKGAINIFLGETVNQADITSPPGYSTGIVVDSEAPVIKNVRGGVSGDSLLFDWEVETSVSPIVRYEYAFVKEAKVNSIAGSDWKTAENNSLDRRLVLDATAYQDGNYCLVVRGYNAAGTYSRHDAEHQEWGISNVITLDRTSPGITTAVFPKYADELMKISVSAMDEGSGIDSYQYAVGTAANQFQFSGGWIDLNDQSSTVNIEIPTNIIPHNTGVYTMVRVKDKVGLWSTPKVSGKTVIDHSKPETPALTYGSYTTNKLLLTGIEYQATDLESGLTNYRLGLVTETGGTWLTTKEEQVQLDSEGKPVSLNLAVNAPGLTENGTYQLAMQVQNGTGDWSEISYSRLITVDTFKPVLGFTRAGETLVINEPPLSVEYNLSEDAQVTFTVTRADGSSKEETVAGITGINQYIFKEATPQVYTITAIVTDKAGNVGETTELTKQSVRVNAPPVVSLPGEIKATLGRKLTFKADVTDPDGIEGDTFTYEWFPGDGSAVLSGATPDHKYEALDDYILTLTVTDKDGGKTTVTSIVKVGNTTSGELCMNETWSGTHRIYGDVIVPADRILTILSGTEIIIDGIPGETGFNHALIVKGTLNAVTETGTETRISFTSITGTTGGWRGIQVEGEAELGGVAIRYAERGVAGLEGSKVTLNNCIFENNLAGVHAYGSSPLIDSCLFRNNAYGIKEDDGGRPVVKGCRFAGNGVDYYHLELTEISMEQLNRMNQVSESEENVKE